MAPPRARRQVSERIQSVTLRAPMDLNLLSLFVTVAEASSFSTAAAKLGVRRSSVSRGVAALERALGVQLFSRTTRNVALTTAGTALHAKVAPHLASLKEAMGTLPEREKQPSGELRVTAPVDIGTILLPSIIAGFTRSYPAVTVDARLSNQRVDLVAEGLDAALRVSTARMSDSTLVARKLSAVELQIFAAPTYLARAGTPRAPEETKEHAWVMYRGMAHPRQLSGSSVKARVIGDDILFVYRLAIAGVGLGLLPTFLTREDVEAGRLIRVLPRFSLRSGALYLVHPPAQHVPRKVTAFRDYLVAHFAAHPLVGSAG